MQPQAMMRIFLLCAVVAGASIHSATAQARREGLQNHPWRLARLGNAEIASTDSATITLRFEDTTYILGGACNRGLGKYWTRGISRIGFGAAAGTWRACPGMNRDAQVADMLKRANRYRIHSSGGVRSLSLRRGWWVIAVFSGDVVASRHR